MSRKGKLPILIPDSVKVTIENQIISAEGPKGSLSLTLRSDFDANVTDNQLLIANNSKSKDASSMHGLF